MSDDGGGKKWLTCGCLGCVGLIVLLLLSAAGLFGTAWVGVRNEQVADRNLRPAIDAGTAEQPLAGRVVLRLTGGEFHVTPAAPGEPLHVEANFDETGYSLVEKLEQQGDSWLYELEFERSGGMMMSLLKMMVGGSGPRVEVFLPPDAPIDLVVEIAQGGSELELGGLWLGSAEIQVDQGGFALEVSEPLRQPMDHLKISGTMGGFAVSGLGNASPRRLEVESSMGGMDLDLRGAWAVDSEISIGNRQGGASVRLPRDVNIVGIEQGRMIAPGNEELPPPTLTFSVESDNGEIDFIE
jgi:hypothetical protein